LRCQRAVLEAHQGERIGMAMADSPDGPWRRFDEPLLDVRPGTWERYLVSNSSPLGRFTQRGDVLYAHLFEWPGRAFVLPVDASFIERVELLTAAKPVPVTRSRSHGASIVLTLPARAPDPHVSVLRVTLRPEAAPRLAPAGR
jgi:hypothetical protein